MNADALKTGVNIREIGSFFVGGHIASLANQPQHSMRVAANAPERLVDLNGDYITGQCYVQYVRHVQPEFELPVMFWHGGAMTGATWETTPDGRSGWQNYFMQRGFDTYVCDAMERGRAGWSPYPEIYSSAPIFRTQNEAWELFRFGEAEGYSSDANTRKPFAGLLFPLRYLETLGAQFVPRWTDHGRKSLQAYYKVLEKTGPVWLIAHSQGGHLALEAASRHPEFFSGIVVIEPASAPEGSANAHTLPHLFVWGDNIARSHTWTSYRRMADAYARKLEADGGQVHTLDLPALGIHGNSHLPMMDTNSDEIAGRIVRWICEQQGS